MDQRKSPLTEQGIYQWTKQPAARTLQLLWGQRELTVAEYLLPVGHQYGIQMAQQEGWKASEFYPENFLQGVETTWGSYP